MNGPAILQAVRAAMQPAEELEGPPSPEYIELMRAIADEAIARLAAYALELAAREIQP